MYFHNAANSWALMVPSLLKVQYRSDVSVFVVLSTILLHLLNDVHATTWTYLQIFCFEWSTTETYKLFERLVLSMDTTTWINFFKSCALSEVLFYMNLIFHHENYCQITSFRVTLVFLILDCLTKFRIYLLFEPKITKFTGICNASERRFLPIFVKHPYHESTCLLVEWCPVAIH